MFSLFNQIVITEPDNIAFILSNKVAVTYGEASGIVILWAKYLHLIGIKQGDRVVLLTQEEDLYPFVHLALDHLNATIVPLDTETPSEQLKQMSFVNQMLMDDDLTQRYSEVPMSLNRLKISGILPISDIDIDTICLPEIIRDESIPSYIVASSGVTQQKKWIPILRAGLLYWARVEREKLQLTREDRILCTRSPGYDARISEYIRSFAAGSALVLLSQHQRRDLHEIVRQCEIERITCLILIASQLSIPNQDELIGRLSRAGLRHLMVTGDACTLSLKLTCEKYNIFLWNCYGPTEATFGMSILCVNHINIYDANGQQIVPVGLPDNELIRYHVDEKGCLYIISPFLSPGYLQNEALTAQNFVTLSNGDRAFNTENKFSKNNGLLVFEGRIGNSSHCKISGVKVEPYAIQLCLEQYNLKLEKEALQVYVVIKPWGNGALKPVAYVVMLHEFCKQDFADYLKANLRKEEMPVIIRLAEFPILRPSEKIDRRALIARVDAPHERFFNESSSHSLDTAPLFAHLQHLWTQVLGMPPSNIDQEFMFSGGDSFQLNQLCVLIQQEISPEFTWQRLLQLPSLTLRQIYYALTFQIKVNRTQALIKPLSVIKSERDNYFFPPPLLGEGCFSYGNLAEQFSRFHDFNLYGLSDPCLQDLSLLPESMEEAVERYIRAIQEVQPHGPYYLAGFSFGATLAWYIAKELIAMGESVNDVQLIDGLPPGYYQQLSPQAYALLLLEQGNFIINILNQRHHGENLALIELPDLGMDEKPKQVHRLFNLIESRLQHQRSRTVVAIARQHLLFILNAPALIKLPVRSRLSLSNRNQPYLDIIKQLSVKGRTPRDVLLYYWDNLFDEISYSPERDALINHLELLARSDKAAAGLSDFWDQLNNGVDAHPIAQVEFEPFYTLESVDEDWVQCKVVGLRRTDRLDQWFPQQLTPIEQQLGPAFDYIIQGEYRKGTASSSRYCYSAIIAKEDVKHLDAFYQKRNIKGYPVSKKTSAPESETLIRENFHISLSITWNDHPLMELSFSCQSHYMDLDYLFRATRALGLNMANDAMPGYSLIRFKKSFWSSNGVSPEFATMSLLHQFILNLEPCINLDAHVSNSPLQQLALLPPEIKYLKNQIPKQQQVELAARYVSNQVKRAQIQQISYRPDQTLVHFLSEQGGYLCIKRYETLCQLVEQLQKKGHELANPPCQFVDFAIALDRLIVKKSDNRNNAMQTYHGSKLDAIILEMLIQVLRPAILSNGAWQIPMLELLAQLLVTPEFEPVLNELIQYYNQFCNAKNNPVPNHSAMPHYTAPPRLLKSPHHLAIQTLSDWETLAQSRAIQVAHLMRLPGEKAREFYKVKLYFRKAFNTEEHNAPIESPFYLPSQYILEHFKFYLSQKDLLLLQLNFSSVISDDLFEKNRLVKQVQELTELSAFANTMDSIIPMESIERVTVDGRISDKVSIRFYLHGQSNCISSIKLFTPVSCHINDDRFFESRGFFKRRLIANHYAHQLDLSSFLSLYKDIDSNIREQLATTKLASVLSDKSLDRIHIKRSRFELPDSNYPIEYTLLHFMDGTHQNLACRNPKMISKYFGIYLDDKSFNAPDIQPFITDQIREQRDARERYLSELEAKQTRLHQAASLGDLELVKVCLNAGDNPDNMTRVVDYHGICRIYRVTKSHEKRTPLHIASYHGHIDVAAALIEAGAAIDIKENHNEAKDTAFAIAIRENNLGIAKMLKDFGARDDNNLLEKKLLKRKIHNELYHAVWDTKPAIIKDIYASGLLDKKNGEEALRLAVRCNNLTIAALLLELGVSPDAYNEHLPLNKYAEDDEHQTPLGIAAAEGNDDMVELLLMEGADVNKHTHTTKKIPDNIPLREALLRGSEKPVNPRLISLLLTAGASYPEIRTDELNWIIEKRNDQEIILLLQHGLNPNIEINEKPLLFICIQEKKYKAAIAFINYGATVHYQDALNKSYLHHSNDVELSCLLLSKGLNIELQDSAGRTPIQCVNGKTAEFLMEQGASTQVLSIESDLVLSSPKLTEKLISETLINGQALCINPIRLLARQTIKNTYLNTLEHLLTNVSSIDINQSGTIDGWTALHDMLSAHDARPWEKKGIDLLITHGAKPLQDKRGRTPLMYVAYKMFFENPDMERYIVFEANYYGIDPAIYKRELKKICQGNTISRQPNFTYSFFSKNGIDDDATKQFWNTVEQTKNQMTENTWNELSNVRATANR